MGVSELGRSSTLRAGSLPRFRRIIVVRVVRVVFMRLVGVGALGVVRAVSVRENDDIFLGEV
jgi:hypothetical protein